MEIDINQKTISIGDKYSIFIDGQQEYFASLKLFTLLPEISLFKANTTEPVLVIEKKFMPFKASFNITIPHLGILEFTTTSVWKSQFQCINGKDTYGIYANKGTKFSIYKNDVQVAYWNHEAVSWFDGDNYRIYADSDCNKELMIAFCLILDNFENNDRGKGALNIDVGNIAWGLKKFDESWQPK
jgi:hypothetical protein